MTIAVVAVVFLLVVAAAVALVCVPSVQVRRRRRARLVVTLKSGASFEGVLFATDRRMWVLRDAHALAAGERGENVPVDGEVLIFTADIEYAQKP